MLEIIIDAPCYPRPFSITEQDYEAAQAWRQAKHKFTAEEILQHEALQFAVTRELMALRSWEGMAGALGNSLLDRAA